eukprot:scaffold49071_cov59-Phaeocystis_antarctica.AAC.8
MPWLVLTLSLALTRTPALTSPRPPPRPDRGGAASPRQHRAAPGPPRPARATSAAHLAGRKAIQSKYGHSSG